MTYVLASASPRRNELLGLILDEFQLEPAHVDESVEKNIPLYEMPAYLADKKARFVSRSHPDDIVIGCDTGVFIDNQMIGKPSNDKSAFHILKLLSGRTHRVITGVAIYQGERKMIFSQVTEVEFYELTDREILDYIATGEPMDKAGAYGIQGKGAVFVKGIKGDYTNVVGLPVGLLKRKLGEFEES